MAKKTAPREELQHADRTRDRNGWKADRQQARKAKGKRRAFESGSHR